MSAGPERGPALCFQGYRELGAPTLVGVIGVTSYSVARRTPEIGVRVHSVHVRARS